MQSISKNKILYQTSAALNQSDSVSHKPNVNTRYNSRQSPALMVPKTRQRLVAIEPKNSGFPWGFVVKIGFTFAVLGALAGGGIFALKYMLAHAEEHVHSGGGTLNGHDGADSDGSTHGSNDPDGDTHVTNSSYDYRVHSSLNVTMPSVDEFFTNLNTLKSSAPDKHSYYPELLTGDLNLKSKTSNLEYNAQSYINGNVGYTLFKTKTGYILIEYQPLPKYLQLDDPRITEAIQSCAPSFQNGYIGLYNCQNIKFYINDDNFTDYKFDVMVKGAFFNVF